jgi:glyoxylase-like metal-dependent hydrolase (beta-lactamase superfamily II)
MTGPFGPIDLALRGMRHVLGSFLVETSGGLALVDCGPTSCLPALRAGLAQHDLSLADIEHLLLTHIHLDHAGAAGVLVREHPGLQVHVSDVGAPHVIDPSRLDASARRLYGEAFDELWGELAPVPEQNVHVVGDSLLGLECFPTPGHASHHVTFLAPDGTMFTGDVTGIRIEGGTFVVPPTPPPDIDLELWERSLDEIERRQPARLALPHYGVFDDVEDHLARLRHTLREWSGRVGHGMDLETFVAAARADVLASDPGTPEEYVLAAPLDHCFHGLERYWRKRTERMATAG